MLYVSILERLKEQCFKVKLKSWFLNEEPEIHQSRGCHMTLKDALSMKIHIRQEIENSFEKKSRRHAGGERHPAWVEPRPANDLLHDVKPYCDGKT